MLFTDFSLGIEGNIILREAEMYLEPGITMLEVPQHAGLTRILNALSDNITHPKGIALISNERKTIFDLHSGNEHPIHYELCGNISNDESVPSFHPTMNQEQIQEFLQNSGLFTQQELSLTNQQWTATNSFFRKRYALAAAASHVLFGNAQVLILDNFNMDINDRDSLEAMIALLKRITDRNIPVLIGCHSNQQTQSNVHNDQLVDNTYNDQIAQCISKKGIPIKRYTIKDQKFIPIE